MQTLVARPATKSHRPKTNSKCKVVRHTHTHVHIQTSTRNQVPRLVFATDQQPRAKTTHIDFSLRMQLTNVRPLEEY